MKHDFAIVCQSHLCSNIKVLFLDWKFCPSCSHHAVNACLAPVCTVHGAAVTTVEGIGSTKTKLHPVQVSKKKWTIAGL